MELLTVKQAAIILKIHPLTVRRYIKEGKLSAIRIAGNIRIKNADLKQLIETFVPQTRPVIYKEIQSQSHIFNVKDPLFSLKGKAISYQKPQK